MKDIRDRLYVPDPEEWLKFCDKKYLSDRPLNVRTVDNGIILPTRQADKPSPYKCRGGVCDRDFHFVAGYTDVTGNPWAGSYVVETAYPVERNEIETCNEDVIFGGLMIYHFGHFLTETLARMWYIAQNPSLKTKVAFVTIKVTHLQVIRPWVYDFLELLGLTKDQIILVERPMQFKSVIVPDQALYLRSSYARECLLPYRYIAERVPPSTHKKIFLSRSPEVVSMMHLSNQEYFEEFYRARGFEIIYPEKLSIAEQVSLIANAEEIVTFLGSLSHWALFCRPSIKFTMLTRVDSDRLVPTRMRQSLINEATDIDWYIVSAARSFLYAEQGGGVCLLGSTEYFRRYVKDQFGETIDGEVIPTGIVGDYIRRWCRFFGKGHEHHQINSIKALYRRAIELEDEIRHLGEEQGNGRERIEGAHLRSQL